MDITISPGLLGGTLQTIPSKSQAHRILICAAFSHKPTSIGCPETNDDIEATAECLRALGARISRTECGYYVEPATTIPESADLHCNESGSTLRFLLPVVGALGVDTTFHMRGRLPERPLSPLWEELERMGCQLIRPTNSTLRCTGRLRSGTFQMDGSVSSQFISGLLFAMALLPEESCLVLSGKIESVPYITMTQDALALFGVASKDFTVSGRLQSPGTVDVEGDWSNAAFFLTANKLGSKIALENLNRNSAQGDRAIIEILQQIDDPISVSAANIPDLVPILSVAAAANKGAVFTDIRRLRMKESDRVLTVANMLQSLGCRVSFDENTLSVEPAPFRSCTIDACGDHRIAMAAAIASTVADGTVTILGAECVAKSYPKFWCDFRKLGGKYE